MKREQAAGVWVAAVLGVLVLCSVQPAASSEVYQALVTLTSASSGSTVQVRADQALFALFTPVRAFSGVLGGIQPRPAGNGSAGDAVLARLEDGCAGLQLNSSRLPQKWIAVLRRGGCLFVDKVNHALAAGAAAVIVVDNVNSATPPEMSGTVEASIPAISMTYRAAAIMLAAYDQYPDLEASVEVGDAVSDRTQLPVATMIVGHIIVFGGTILLMSLCVMGAYYCRGRAERREQRRALRRMDDALKSLPTRVFRTADLASPDEEAPVCCICLDEHKDGDELRVLPCKHEFHKGCGDPWLREHHTCPLCKADILDAEPGASPRARRSLARSRAAAAGNSTPATSTTTVNTAVTRASSRASEDEDDLEAGRGAGEQFELTRVSGATAAASTGAAAAVELSQLPVDPELESPQQAVEEVVQETLQDDDNRPEPIAHEASEEPSSQATGVTVI